MKILSTKLMLCTAQRWEFLYEFADKLRAKFYLNKRGPTYVRLITIFLFGDEICSEYQFDLTQLIQIKDMDGYVHYIKEQLIQQTSELIENQIRDQLDPPEPFVDTGLKFRGSPLFFKTSGSRETDRQLKHSLLTAYQNPDP